MLGTQAGPVTPARRPPGQAGCPDGAVGATWAAMQPRGSWTRVRNGRWAPGTGRLLLLTLGLGLAGAQQAAEEVPVQPGFDARKVTVPLGPRLGLGPRRGASVARRGHCGGSGQGEQETAGERRAGEGRSRHSPAPGCSSGRLCHTAGGGGGGICFLHCPPLALGKRGPALTPVCVTPPARHLSLWGGGCRTWGEGGGLRGGVGGTKRPGEGRRQTAPAPPPAPSADAGPENQGRGLWRHTPRRLTRPCVPLQVEGRWLTVQLAASRADLVSPDDPLRLALHSIRSRDADLELVLFWT